MRVRRRTAAVMLLATPLLCIAITAVATRLFAFSLLLYAIAVAAAILSAIIAGAGRSTELAAAALGSLGVVIAHAVWLFLAIATASYTDRPDAPSCASVGVSGPFHLETVVFPTALWCVSESGSGRAPLTTPLATLGLSSVCVVLIALGIGVAVYAWRRARRLTAGA